MREPSRLIEENGFVDARFPEDEVMRALSPESAWGMLKGPVEQGRTAA